jgi:tellurite resistance protein
MFDMMHEIDITADQAEAIARGLISVAKADGNVHEREGALIADFYGAITEKAIDLVALQRTEQVDGSYLAATLSGKALREIFIRTAILLAYADGNFSPDEGKLIVEYATALGINEDDLDKIEQQVKEFMLSQLSGLKNSEAVAEVAKELKV